MMNTMDRPTAALGLSPPQPAEHSAEQFEQFHQPALELVLHNRENENIGYREAKYRI
jgi:hypothetical protein